MPARRLVRSLVPAQWRPRAIAAHHLIARGGLAVLAGPFQGLRYAPPEGRDWYYPQLLGTYEKELVPALESQLGAGEIDRVIVAGAAEGYYAVGLARRLPGVPVSAFEVDPRRRAVLRAMADRNQVEIEIHALCDLSSLGRLLGAPERTLLIADIEGGEALLLDPEALPALRRTRMLVEVHDCFVPAVGDVLASRFSASHRVERFDPIRRRAADFPPVGLPYFGLLSSAYLSLMEEGRPPGCYWLSLSLPDSRP